MNGYDSRSTMKICMDSGSTPLYSTRLVLDGIGSLAYTQVHKVRLLGGVLNNRKEKTKMSRSWKRNPYCKDRGIGKDAKQIAAARLRCIPIDSEESEILVTAPANYKKINHDTWDIHDYISRWDRKQAIADYYESMNEEAWNSQKRYEKFIKDYPTVEDYLTKNWAKYYKRK